MPRLDHPSDAPFRRPALRLHVADRLDRGRSQDRQEDQEEDEDAHGRKSAPVDIVTRATYCRRTLISCQSLWHGVPVAPIRSVAIIALPGVQPFELGVAWEGFGIDRTDDGVPPYDCVVVSELP